METDYIFDSATDLGREHLDRLSDVLDVPTTNFISEIGPLTGARCLDVGAGNGSVARWLAERVGPTGEVHAVDMETAALDPGPAVQVHRADVTDGIPVPGSFDLIHARMLLVHLPERERVVQMFIDALAPGGWLVVGDLSDRKLQVLSAPSEEDRRLFERIQHLSLDVVSVRVGMDFGWAQRAYGVLGGLGLTDLDAMEHAFTSRGGDPACRLHDNLNRQGEALLLAEGATPAELERYRELVADPRFRAWFYQLVLTRGRKPA